MFPLAPEGLTMVTLYSKPITPTAQNFDDMDLLMAACNDLKPTNPATGRFVIVSTYQTFCNAAMKLNKGRRLQRHIAKKIPVNTRVSNFDADDFDLIWDAPLERIIIDEGHIAKNPLTTTNATLCKREEVRNMWLLSATPIDNSAEDIFGLTKLMRGQLERADLGVLSALAKRKGRTNLDNYIRANELWEKNVTDARGTRTFMNGRPRRPDPWFKPDGETTAEQYALELLHHDIIHMVLTDKENLDGNRIGPSTAKIVIGLSSG